MARKSVKKGLSTTQIILIIGIALILAVLIVFGVILINKNKTQTPELANVVTDEDNVVSAKEETDKKVEDGMFELKMNTNWVFEDGITATEDAYVANVENNSSPLYIEIILDDGTVVYKSGIIPLGGRLKEIKLNKKLDKGTYNATCQYHLLNEDGTEKSTFGVGVTLTSLN